MIRQAISCDICGTEKKQTNHWFVAYDQGGELRVSGWGSRNRTRPGAKHLCGQTCLHKLVDDFMAKALSVRVPAGAVEEDEVEERAEGVDASLTSGAAYVEVESSARLLPTPTALARAGEPVKDVGRDMGRRDEVELVAALGRSQSAASPLKEALPFTSPNRRAEAWEREREREQRGIAPRPGIVVRRRASF